MPVTLFTAHRNQSFQFTSLEKMLITKLVELSYEKEVSENLNSKLQHPYQFQCLTHTHHLGIDTELFAVAPIMILSLWKWPKNTLKVLLGLCALGTAARYYTSIVNELSNYVYFGTK